MSSLEILLTGTDIDILLTLIRDYIGSRILLIDVDSIRILVNISVTVFVYALRVHSATCVLLANVNK